MTTQQKKMKPHPLFDTLDRYANQYNIADYPALDTFFDTVPVDSAHQEFELMLEFLALHDGAKGTFNLYRTEVQRLLLYLWLVENKPLRNLCSEVLLRYLKFIQSPPEDWIARSNYPGFSLKQGVYAPDDRWRPFVNRQRLPQTEPNADDKLPPYQVAPSSFRVTNAALETIGRFLLKRQVLTTNPMDGVPIKARRLGGEPPAQTPGKHRRLTDHQWSLLVSTLTLLADEDPKLERELFAIVTMKALFLRVSELAVWPIPDGNDRVPVFGWFKEESEKDEHWWIYQVTGKGNKSREVSVPTEYLDYLTRYRRSRGLSDLPSPGERTPLLTSKGGKPLGRRQVTRIVQQAFNRVADKLEEDSRAPDTTPSVRDRIGREVVKLRDIATSTHYLRHTGASQALDNAGTEETRFVSEELGHGDPYFTDKTYIGSDLAKRRRHGASRKV